MLKIQYELKSDRRREPFVPSAPLPFGELRSDHMFLMDYQEGQWHSPRIVPYGPLPIMPGAVCLNYGQEIFEGIKAFRHDDGELYLFRPKKHAMRFNDSADIVRMPRLPKSWFVHAAKALLDVDRLWYPEQENASLYLRPLMIGTEDCLGVRESKMYTFVLFVSPSGSYYPQGFSPIKVLITNKFHRATPGGTGRAKTGGNYAASLRAKHYAHEQGADQVLYLDVTNRFLEETGASNHYHVRRDGTIEIPALTDTILKSVTAQSFLALSERLGHPVQRRRIPVDEFVVYVRAGEITEMGGLGTAAVVSPVKECILDAHKRKNRGPDLEGRIRVGTDAIGEVTAKMYDLLTRIQRGKEEAPEGWLEQVPRAA